METTIEKFQELLGKFKQYDKDIASLEESMRHMATKEDLRHMATKEDLRHMATKEDMKHMATKEDLAKLETRMTHAMYRVVVVIAVPLLGVLFKLFF